MSNNFKGNSTSSHVVASQITQSQHNSRESQPTESDFELRGQIVARLAQRGISVPDRLILEIGDGIVTVSGRVPTYYQRQLIIHAIRNIPAVVRIMDSIEVAPSDVANARVSPIAGAAANRQPLPRKRFIPIKAAIALFASLALASCGKPHNEIPVYPVEGKLTFEGEPAAGAFLVLHPLGHELPKTVQPKARVGQDGTFRLATFSNGDGAPEGEYTLTVEWRKLVDKNGDVLPGPNIIPRQYSSAETSDLRVKVAKGKNEWEPLQLSAAANGGNSVTQ